MLTVTEAIRRRRSIRSFRSDPVPDDMVSEIVEAARRAPSGSNRQPWRFIVVADGEEKAKLRRICLDQAFIEEAPVVIVCCADMAAYSRSSSKKRAQEFLDYGVTKTLSGRFADPAYRASLYAEPDSNLGVFLPRAA